MSQKKKFAIAKVVASKAPGTRGLFELFAVDAEGNKVKMRGQEFGGGKYFSYLNEMLTDGTIVSGSKDLEFQECQAVVIVRNNQPIAIARISE